MNAGAEAARRIDANPLGRLMYGQRELFHSNFLAWFFDSQEEAADAVFRHYSHPAPGVVQERECRREERHLDLVLRWSERTPVIVENKTFSMPLPGQLADYRQLADDHYPQASLVLLSLSAPDFDPTPWVHLSYGDLAARIRAALPERDSYDAQTILKWCDLADDLQALVESCAVKRGDELVWLSSESLERIRNSQTVTALHKARAQRVAAHLLRAVPGERTQVWSALAHGTPLVEILETRVVDTRTVDIGWQLQDNQFRRVVRFKEGQFTRHGRLASTKADEFCEQHPELFEFPAIPGASLGGRKWFNHFGAEFVYRYVKVPHLTIAQLVDAATEVHTAVGRYPVALPR